MSFTRKKNGYFIEIGAYDGIAISNTYALERQLGWKGICVEPLPTRFADLVTNRTANCCDLAVYHTTGLNVSFDIAGGDCSTIDMLSGINMNIDTRKQLLIAIKKLSRLKQSLSMIYSRNTMLLNLSSICRLILKVLNTKSCAC